MNYYWDKYKREWITDKQEWLRQQGVKIMVDINDVMYLKEVLEEMPQDLFAEFTQLNDVLRICNEIIEENVYGHGYGGKKDE